MNANVWKVLAKEDQVLTQRDLVMTILEAMKLEINVMAEERLVGAIVEKVLISPNDVVEGGQPLFLVRKKEL